MNLSLTTVFGCRRITVPNPISRIFLRRSNRKYRFVTLVIYASLDPHPICFNTSRILYFTKLHCINKLVWINSSRRMSPECFIKSILLSIFFIIQNSRKIRSKELFLTGTKKKIYLSERHFLSRIIFPPNGKKKKMRKEIEIIKFDDESKPQIKFIGCKTTFQMEQ